MVSTHTYNAPIADPGAVHTHTHTHTHAHTTHHRHTLPQHTHTHTHTHTTIDTPPHTPTIARAPRVNHHGQITELIGRLARQFAYELLAQFIKRQGQIAKLFASAATTRSSISTLSSTTTSARYDQIASDMHMPICLKASTSARARAQQSCCRFRLLSIRWRTSYSSLPRSLATSSFTRRSSSLEISPAS